MAHIKKIKISPNFSNLTGRQQDVLRFIQSQIKQIGYPPTIREIGKELGLKSTNGVNDHLKALERKGFIARELNKSRSLRVLHGPDKDGANEDRAALANPDNVIPFAGMDGETGDLVDIPLLGRVAAGVPILAEADAEGSVQVSSFLIGRGNSSQKVFALRVVGESMIEDGIHDGDFLFVRKQPVANTGEIVIAMIDGEATVKRFFPEGDRIRFQPANVHMDPIFVERQEFRQTDILGIVVGVYRKYN
jgi:repressor LexA